MPVVIRSLDIPEVKLIIPSIHQDERGFFCESYSRKALADAGLEIEFVQENHSLSRPAGVVRGLHCQAEPHPQGKLVRVVRGEIFDVAVDIRRGSPTFGRHVSAVLSAANWSQLWIPVGFLHGFCTLEPNTEVVYKVSDYYAPECDRGVAFDDPELAINWPIARREAILSAKDARNPQMRDLPTFFTYR